MDLHPDFLSRPLAHRALHDVTDGRPENSRAAVQAAIEAGYGIEIDLQLSADGRAMVFHDYWLNRLTDETGAVRQRDAKELSNIPLKGGNEGIPTFAEILDLVSGRVPLLVELKDQDGALGAKVGELEAAVAGDIAGYEGPIAFMSFNPHAMIRLGELAPETCRGLTTSAFLRKDWPGVPSGILARLAAIPDLDETGARFISHDATDLQSVRVADIKQSGLPVLCWTIRSEQAEMEARRIVDNVTFEGYLAA